MGGALSEPGTLVDLQECIRLLYTHPDMLKEIGWKHRDFTVNQIVQGITHVDDSLVISKVLCHDCLYEGCCRLFPKDVGTSLEETGPYMRFLNSWLIVGDESIHVLPFSPNVRFALHLDDKQKVARLGDFNKSIAFTYRMLRQFMVSQILTYDGITNGHDPDAMAFVIILVSEIRRLNWPPAWIFRALKSIPNRHMSSFVRDVRQLAKNLKRTNAEHPDDDMLQSEILGRILAQFPAACSLLWEAGTMQE